VRPCAFGPDRVAHLRTDNTDRIMFVSARDAIQETGDQPSLSSGLSDAMRPGLTTGALGPSIVSLNTNKSSSQ
jgi:hypothetical protein